MMHTLRKLTAAFALVLSAANLAPVYANPANAVETSATDGEIKKIDKDAGKLTIKHGELKNLQMPPMTMVFRVKDKAMLEQLKTGDKVSFAADKVNNQLTVTQIEVKK